MFFGDFRMVFLCLINHVDLFLVSSGNFWIYLYKRLLRVFSPFKIIGNWEILQKLFWVSLTKLFYFPPFVFNVLHVAFSDYKSGFGGKFGVQTERQDPSAVGFEYKEKLAKHESQQGTVFTCYFLNSAATSHTVLNSCLSRSMLVMCRHFLALLFLHDLAMFFHFILKMLRETSLYSGNDIQCLAISSKTLCI